MPKRKNEARPISYYVPQNTEEIIGRIVSAHPDHYNPKHRALWTQKLYHLVDTMCYQLSVRKLDPSVNYINTNQDISQKILGVDNTKMAVMLDHLVAFGLIECDKKMKVADKVNGRKVKGTGKSYGYRFPGFERLVEVIAEDRKKEAHRISDVTRKLFINGNPLLSAYSKVMSEVSLGSFCMETLMEEIVLNRAKKGARAGKYRWHMDRLQKAYLRSTVSQKAVRKIKEHRSYNVPYRPCILTSTTTCYPTLYTVPIDDMIVPEKMNVACEPCIYSVMPYHEKTVRAALGKYSEDEHSLRIRLLRAVRVIESGDHIPTRPVPGSRVYTAVTSLNREFRKHLRLGGRQLIGLDIRNSQPLIASVLFLTYWQMKDGTVPEDVTQYISDCEQGVFYDHFMALNGITCDMRAEFKGDFYSLVFFAKLTPGDHILKAQFRERYPSCWEAIWEMKGGYYHCETFNEFAKALQEVEAGIMFDGVNRRLMEMGIKAFNIFDSIYVGSMEEYKVAEQFVIEEFAVYGLRPTINAERYDNDSK